MKQGKKICETLKAIRRDIAVANDIDYARARLAGWNANCAHAKHWARQ